MWWWCRDGGSHLVITSRHLYSLRHNKQQPSLPANYNKTLSAQFIQWNFHFRVGTFHILTMSGLYRIIFHYFKQTPNMNICVDPSQFHFYSQFIQITFILNLFLTSSGHQAEKCVFKFSKMSGWPGLGTQLTVSKANSVNSVIMGSLIRRPEKVQHLVVWAGDREGNGIPNYQTPPGLVIVEESHSRDPSEYSGVIKSRRKEILFQFLHLIRFKLGKFNTTQYTSLERLSLFNFSLLKRQGWPQAGQHVMSRWSLHTTITIQ